MIRRLVHAAAFSRAATLALVAALAVVASPAAAVGQDTEEILSYDVTVEVEDDGWMEVSEEIRVRALGNQIRRGIYRDFPTSFPRPGGMGTIRAPFEVVGVLRNGQPERYVLESVGGPAGRGGIRVRIGDANTLLDHGVHEYVLVYRTIRWIDFGEDVDRLYWNVTGNGWDFPIRRASARVHLPGTVDPDDVTLEGWTGPEGATERDLTARFDPDAGPAGAALFETTEPLGPREGLTIRLTFPKGVVSPPTEEQLSEWFRLDWGHFVEAGIVTLLVLLFYLVLWHRIGRDPKGRAIVVRYEPPEGFSPAALGHVVERGYDARQLTAALVSLAVKGWVEIERTGDDWILRPTGEKEVEAEEDLPHEERLLLKKLFGRTAGGMQRTITLTGTSDSTVRKAAQTFRQELKRLLEKRYFVLNRGWFVVGLAVTAAGFGFLALRVRYSIPPEGWFMGLWLTFWTMGTATLVYRAAGEWRKVFGGDLGSAVGALFLTLFSVPFVGAEIFVGFLLWQAVPAHLVAAAVVLGGLNVLFYHLLERPTLKGRGVLDEAEGFRRFLTATEEDRLRVLQPEDEPLVLFERFLPYAIALGVESRWAERFESVLVAPDGTTATTPHRLGWYHGAAATSSSLSGLTGSLGGALSSSLSASSSAPSSSGGGGGGGGSSGGGGGGGGGGGW